MKLKKDARNQFESALMELVGKLPEPERVVLNTLLDKPVPPSEEEISPQTVEDEPDEE